MTMAKVIFKATRKHPKYLHKRGGVAEGTYAGKATKKIVPPVILEDGDEVEVTKRQLAWLLKYYPENFTEKKSTPSKSKTPEPPKESPSEE